MASSALASIGGVIRAAVPAIQQTLPSPVKLAVTSSAAGGGMWLRGTESGQQGDEKNNKTKQAAEAGGHYAAVAEAAELLRELRLVLLEGSEMDASDEYEQWRLLI